MGRNNLEEERVSSAAVQAALKQQLQGAFAQLRLHKYLVPTSALFTLILSSDGFRMSPTVAVTVSTVLLTEEPLPQITYLQCRTLDNKYI